MARSTATACRYGLTHPAMTACGRMIKPTEWVHSFMLMATSTRECGLMTRPMDMARIGMQMAPLILVSGLRMSSMDRVWKLGPTVPDMMVAIKMGRRMEKVR